MDRYSYSYHGATTLHPLTAIAVAVFAVFVFTNSRQKSLFPYFAAACFIPAAQRIVVGGLDFNILRLLSLFYVARILIRGEWKGFQWKPMDTAVVVWGIYSGLALILRQGISQSLALSMGVVLDGAGIYLIFRCLIRSYKDWQRIIECLLLLSIPVAFFFSLEKVTHRNLFSVFGGVPFLTTIRDGRLRVQGAFAHPIVAGCFWATLMPFFVSRSFKPGVRKGLTILGTITSLIIVFDCASSTPIMAILFGIVAAGGFIIRDHMRIVRWGTVITLVSLHMVMKGPVWHLLSRVNVVSGSTGYHRYLLVDQFIKRVNEWFIIGLDSTDHWGHFMHDLANQYVYEGVRGGIIKLVLFIWMLVNAYSMVGVLVKQSNSKQAKMIGWSFGVALFMHCMSFLSLSYFGQIVSLWLLLLAGITSVAPIRKSV